MHSIIIKTNEKNLLITENRKGVFYYAAINNQFYPIIFFYEKFQKFFKKETIIDLIIIFTMQ